MAAQTYNTCVEKFADGVTIRPGLASPDNSDQPPGNKNPDCLFFERYMPNFTMPGCEESARVPLIGPARQQEITRAAVRDFFDAYLKQDAAALARLRHFDKDFSETELLKDD